MPIHDISRPQFGNMSVISGNRPFAGKQWSKKSFFFATCLNPKSQFKGELLGTQPQKTFQSEITCEIQVIFQNTHTVCELLKTSLCVFELKVHSG